MPILTKGTTFANNDQVTSSKLNNLVDAAAFVAGSSGTTDDATLEVASGQLRVKTIQSGNIASLAVTEGKIGNLAVTSGKIAALAVGTPQIADSGVTVAKLANDAVEAAKIKNANVTAEKLSGGQTGAAPVFGARAWCQFDANRNAAGGTDSANTARYIYASGNVTSVTKTGSGVFAVAMTTPLPSVNYAVIGGAINSITDLRFLASNPASQTTSSFTITIRDSAGNLESNNSSCTFCVFG